MSKRTQNYKFYCTVDNFSSLDKELIFVDFRIIKIKQGPKAAEWRRKLHCKEVPGYILEKNFLNYAVTDEDISGVDNIMHSMQDLLICFRLFDVGDGKGGDIGFGNFLFEDISGKQNNLIGLSNPINVSSRYKYPFEKGKIEEFNDFRVKTINSCGSLMSKLDVVFRRKTFFEIRIYVCHSEAQSAEESRRNKILRFAQNDAIGTAMVVAITIGFFSLRCRIL